MVKTLDSGSDVHLLTFSAAMLFFEKSRVFNLSFVGVSGSSNRTDVMGQLIVT